ncbi:putative isxac3 transposase orfa (fragment) protein [Xanthomonas albilineans GPE PC73]|uniref:Putative isxac3 transposase orfa protein n=1 Tax=Xanthomonas albilineans (strain GPE PC73 / CFBP 7063) TaxID=380358 RepID=D2UE17_XANAP
MSSKRYPDEFKFEAFRQVIDRGFKVAQVVGWAMRDRADTELVMQALLSAGLAAQTRIRVPGLLGPRVGLHQR